MEKIDHVVPSQANEGQTVGPRAPATKGILKGCWVGRSGALMLGIIGVAETYKTLLSMRRTALHCIYY
jgi:hypothetical protein